MRKKKMDITSLLIIDRVSKLEERMDRLENSAVLGETFPEQQKRKAEEAIEGYKPDRVFQDGAEQKPG